MNAAYEKLLTCYGKVRDYMDFKPEVAMVLGSGLGEFAQRIQIEGEIDYAAIEGFPTSTVAGHKGRYVFGYVEKTPVMLMHGRVHYYEGYSMSDVVLPVRLMGLMGAKRIFLTNAAGGINEAYRAGDFMAITDQIASFVPSPLRGENMDELGTRFPDMGEIYSKRLRERLKTAAKELGIALREGVYVQACGPNYESPREIKMFRALGADAVGMSTAVEAIAARHMGMEVCGVSCITNLAAGMEEKEMSHADVQEVASRTQERFIRLLWEGVRNMRIDGL